MSKLYAIPRDELPRVFERYWLATLLDGRNGTIKIMVPVSVDDQATMMEVTCNSHVAAIKNYGEAKIVYICNRYVEVSYNNNCEGIFDLEKIMPRVKLYTVGLGLIAEIEALKAEVADLKKKLQIVTEKYAW